ncbi:MAG: hypothetical protein ACP5LE_08245, partial [Thermoplasmata archaeon]
ITALGAMLLGGLQKVWEAVAKAVNAVLNWIKKIITDVISKVIEQILSAIEGLKQSLLKIIDEFISGVSNIKEIGQKFGAVICSSQIWTLILTLAISIVALMTALNVILKVVSGGGDFVVGLILQMIGKAFISCVVEYALIEATIAGVAGIVAYLIPRNNTIWNTSIFINAIALVQAIIDYIIIRPDMEAFKKSDARGLVVIFLGIIVDLFSLGVQDGWYKLIFSLASFVVSAIGFYYTLGDDIIDILIDGPIAYVEEIIGAVSVVYSAVSLLKSVAEVLKR